MSAATICTSCYFEERRITEHACGAEWCTCPCAGAVKAQGVMCSKAGVSGFPNRHQHLLAIIEDECICCDECVETLRWAANFTRGAEEAGPE